MFLVSVASLTEKKSKPKQPVAFLCHSHCKNTIVATEQQVYCLTEYRIALFLRTVSPEEKMYALFSERLCRQRQGDYFLFFFLCMASANKVLNSMSFAQNEGGKNHPTASVFTGVSCLAKRCPDRKLDQAVRKQSKQRNNQSCQSDITLSCLQVRPLGKCLVRAESGSELFEIFVSVFCF